MLGPILALAHITERLRKIRTLLNPDRLARVADIVRGEAWASELERQRMVGWLERIAEEVGSGTEERREG